MTQELLFQLKENEQDFEWYPTTQAMIRIIAGKCAALYDGTFSMLDIGAGDGRVLASVDKLHNEFVQRKDKYRSGGLSEKYAIEKSPILIQNMPDDVTIVGTDFIEQTLIDKKVDVLFCNPPYSDFKNWMNRIIRECNCAHLFMIVPQRWKEDKDLLESIKRRGAKHTILQSTDFYDGEREARAVVDILYFDMTVDEKGDRRYHGNRDGAFIDPFDVWFEEHFKFQIQKEDKDEDSDYAKKEKDKARIDHLVKGKNQITALVELYRADLDKLIANYQAVGSLDADILKELGVSVDGLKKALRQKITGLKTLYWEELFGKLSSITNRLTTNTRNEMLKRLNQHMSVDFTEGNIYAVVIWALKNVNKYIDSQLIALYMEMTREENVANYKSNRHMTKDTWRYCNGYGRMEEERKKDLHHYALEYRIVLHMYGAIESRSWDHRYSVLSNTAENFIGDILTVANNLGFRNENDVCGRHWEAGQSQTFRCIRPGSGFGSVIFCEIRAFKNGNLHIKFDQEFMKALNIEAGRLNGWIKSPKEAAEEMGMTEDDAEKSFMSNLKITSVPMLTSGEAA